jgi:hypothetical protein
MASSALNRFCEWAVTGSNRRPPACKAGALPAELTARACHLSRNQAIPETKSALCGALFVRVVGLWSDRPSYIISSQGAAGIPQGAEGRAGPAGADPEPKAEERKKTGTRKPAAKKRNTTGVQVVAN